MAVAVVLAIGLGIRGAIRRASHTPCAGRLVRIEDPRSFSEIARLPTIAMSVELSRSERAEPFVVGVTTTKDCTYALGPYEVRWTWTSDRGRPGPEKLRISRPDLCEGGELEVSYLGAGGMMGGLHHDAASGADAVVVYSYPNESALVFRLVPEPK
jgi:hypothetical protein